MTEIRSPDAVDRALSALIAQIQAAYDAPPQVVGLRTGGAWIAQRICAALEWPDPAILDVALYRDDFETRGLRCAGTTDGMPASLHDQQVLLVDDVLYTGRTVRAALNVLFDYGRPKRIDLAILYDRQGRELPIAAQFLGEDLGPLDAQRCKLMGPEPLTLVVAPSEEEFA